MLGIQKAFKFLFWTGMSIGLLYLLFSVSNNPITSAGPPQAIPKATASEVAEFWDKVFNGPAPYGVPPLNVSRLNRRTVGDSIVWDVRFDSYRDPDTDKPARIGGIFAIPNNIDPTGSEGTFPGLVVTHSVGVAYPAPDNALEMATYFAQRGYAALALYIRGYGTSRLSRLNEDSPLGRHEGYFTANLGNPGAQPLDMVWAGFVVDAFQAGEFMAAQPEVLDPDNMAFIGHSLGGLVALHAGIFSERFKTIAASAPAASAADLDAWMDYWKPSGWWKWAEKQPNPRQAMAQLTQMWSYTGTYQAINNPYLVARNPDWKLDKAEIWFYGGQKDPATSPWGVEATYLLADSSNNKAFHWSPTGGHGGPESWNRAQAWLAGHYPGKEQAPPTADLRVVSITERTSVAFSGKGSSDDNILVAWDYDFGDGMTRNWGDTVSHTYAGAGTYTAILTVTDGAGLRDTASTVVIIEGNSD